MLRILMKLNLRYYVHVLRSTSAAIILRKISNPIVTLPGYKNIRTPLFSAAIPPSLTYHISMHTHRKPTTPNI